MKKLFAKIPAVILVAVIIFSGYVPVLASTLEPTIAIVNTQGDELSTWTRGEMYSAIDIDRLIVSGNVYSIDAFFNSYAGLSFRHIGMHRLVNDNIPNSPIFVAQVLAIVEGRTSAPRVCLAAIQTTVADQPAQVISDNIVSDRTTPFLYTQSEITLPNRRLTALERQAWIDEYNDNGGASAFEMEVIRLINGIRVQHGLNSLQICENLMMASRFYSQTLVDLNLALSHNAGPYGSSRAVAESFGVNNRRGANGTRGRWTEQDVVDGWMNSSGHRNNILRAEITHVGFGSYLGGLSGQSLFHYMMTR